ncbi:hypothetical protein VTN77DRAFT_1092 [Rasamsonia byssochlamydoides]|uniref:uncharacterized protein n=1 Tax=Rasamsonia byssochlamydoides TaxID=89139 RepID=UPI003742B3D7
MRTQADGLSGPLPSSDSVFKRVDSRVPQIRKLTRRQDFEKWELGVKSLLREFSLLDLINPTIAHPDITHANYKKWETASRLVRNVLVSLLDSDVCSEIPASGTPHRNPDELMWAIREAVNPPSIIALSVYMDAVSIKRLDYTLGSDFIKALQRQVRHAHRFQMPIRPFQATFILLRGF